MTKMKNGHVHFQDPKGEIDIGLIKGVFNEDELKKINVLTTGMKLKYALVYNIN